MLLCFQFCSYCPEATERFEPYCKVKQRSLFSLCCCSFYGAAFIAHVCQLNIFLLQSPPPLLLFMLFLFGPGSFLLLLVLLLLLLLLLLLPQLLLLLLLLSCVPSPVFCYCCPAPAILLPLSCSCYTSLVLWRLEVWGLWHFFAMAYHEVLYTTMLVTLL